MSRGLMAEKTDVGTALRWAVAGALVLGVHLGVGAWLLGRAMPPRRPDAAAVGIPINLEPVTVSRDDAQSPAAPTTAPATMTAPEAPVAAEPLPADPAAQPPPEPRIATADPPLPAPTAPSEAPPAPPAPEMAAEPPPPGDAPPVPPPRDPLPDLPKSRDADDAVLARPPPKPKRKPVVARPPKKTADRVAEARRDSAVREAARQERRDAGRQRDADRRTSAAAAPPRRIAGPAPQAAASTGEIASWRGALVAHLNRFKRAPPGGGTGTARVGFSVTADGGVVGIRLASSSGDAELDQAALSMVQRADPVPPPPSGMGGRVSLSVPVHFGGP